MTTTATSPPCSVHLAKEGSRQRLRISYPLPRGRYHLVDTPTATLHFDLNGDILRARGKKSDWPHPHEWLQRTRGNDWVYYSTGGYTGVFEATGEYYLPNHTYPTNSILGGQPFALPPVQSLLANWPHLLARAAVQPGLPAATTAFLQQAVSHTPTFLQQQADEFRAIVGGRISVLPPDARHVDYVLLPLTIARGCLYKCAFCRVKNGQEFQPLPEAAIVRQLEQLRAHFADDLGNCNGIFLGEHDALAAPPQLILTALAAGHRCLDSTPAYLDDRHCFLFGSVGALLAAPEWLFADLAQGPGMTVINIGYESADQATLDHLGKPITTNEVRAAFRRAREINQRYPNLEITGNFLLDEELPVGHYPSVLALIREGFTHHLPKGCVYFSPRRFAAPSRHRLLAFLELKRLSRLPAYLYIIQRL